jgi:hypothetical protein
MGSGRQRVRFGSTSPRGAAKRAEGSGRNGASENDGRTRYIQTREFSALRTVNGVPLRSSG